MGFLLAIDQGTTGTTSLLLDSKSLKVLDKEKQDYKWSELYDCLKTDHSSGDAKLTSCASCSVDIYLFFSKEPNSSISVDATPLRLCVFRNLLDEFMTRV